MNNAGLMAAKFLQEYCSDDRDFAKIHFRGDGNIVRMYQGIGQDIQHASFELDKMIAAIGIGETMQWLSTEAIAIARKWNPRPWWDSPMTKPTGAGKWRKWGRAA